MIQAGPFRSAALAAICLMAAGCGSSPSEPATPAVLDPFDADVAFLREHTEVVLLTNGAARVAVAPGYQGRVMTSTTGGTKSPSFGWIGRTAIASRERQPHMNVFGGEDRFWLGPEGGQYALYFRRGDPFDLEHWQVPEPIDWGPWDVTSRSATAVQFRKRMTLVNYAGTGLAIEVDRTVRMLGEIDIAAALGDPPGSAVRAVAFESSNSVTNVGSARWLPASGLVSVWILGMFSPSRETTVVIPFVPGPVSTHGPVVNDRYFGKVPADRLIMKDAVLFFRGDGQYRSKIGLSPLRAVSVAGSYDAAGRTLTLVQYTRPAGALDYVNSMWEIQREPYRGDAINSYNDGPPAPGAPPLGPFYELETSSPALSLSPGERHTHIHRTFHFVGPEQDLDRLARRALNVGLEEIVNAFR